MSYIILFLGGISTFISPCILPMLPVYVLYFTGDSGGQGKGKILRNAIGFSIGFTVIFVLLGAFAGTFGRMLREYQTAVNLLTGTLVIIFGLNFLGLFQLPWFGSSFMAKRRSAGSGIFSSFLFGVAFSIGWTPCAGAFLGTALLLASRQGSILQGILMLLCYSLGLAVPFVLSAVFIGSLKGAFQFLKKHNEIISKISGAALILIGILMMIGRFHYVTGLFA